MSNSFAIYLKNTEKGHVIHFILNQILPLVEPNKISIARGSFKKEFQDSIVTANILAQAQMIKSTKTDWG